MMGGQGASVSKGRKRLKEGSGADDGRSCRNRAGSNGTEYTPLASVVASRFWLFSS